MRVPEAARPSGCSNRKATSGSTCAARRAGRNAAATSSDLGGGLAIGLTGAWILAALIRVPLPNPAARPVDLRAGQHRARFRRLDPFGLIRPAREQRSSARKGQGQRNPCLERHLDGARDGRPEHEAVLDPDFDA